MILQAARKHQTARLSVDQWKAAKNPNRPEPFRVAVANFAECRSIAPPRDVEYMPATCTGEPVAVNVVPDAGLIFPPANKEIGGCREAGVEAIRLGDGKRETCRHGRRVCRNERRIIIGRSIAHRAVILRPHNAHCPATSSAPLMRWGEVYTYCVANIVSCPRASIR